MLAPNDLVGHQFGPFKVIDVLGSGREAEVFRVWHVAVDRFFALRISVANPLWSSSHAPTRIDNVGDELANVRGAWHFQEGPPETRTGEHMASWVIKPPFFYGLYDDRYLVPVGDRYRLKHDIDVDELLRRTSDVDASSHLSVVTALYTVMAQYALLVSGGKPSWSEWQELVGRWFAGESFVRWIVMKRSEGELDVETTRRILAVVQVSTRAEGVPDPADNLLIRLWAGMRANRITPEDYTTTARSTHFHKNVGSEELFQASQISSVLRQAHEWMESERLTMVLDRLDDLIATVRGPSVDQFTDGLDPSVVVETPIPGQLTRFTTIVQDAV